MKPIRVLIFGTHPNQYNGYSKVVYELVSLLSKRQDLEITVYGFQKFNVHASHRSDIPSNIEIYDAYANEEPKQQGFGIDQIRDFVKKNKPDVCIVYNDMMILHQVISKLALSKSEDKMDFKIIAYIDQVYLNQKKEFIDFINTNADFGLMFTEYWQQCILDQGLKLPHDFLPHGFNPNIYYPIPKKLARLHYGINVNDFIILNLNRNQPRKRWDTCLKAFAEIVSRYPNEPIKMMIGTALQGAWNLIEIFERELKKRNCTLEDGMKHIIVLDRPQRVTDEETNILYNIADVGINTCDGEGFGLCNFEQAGLGIPQIVPRLGGFMDFFDDSNSYLIEPKLAYYVDHSRDMVAGEALMCNYIDFTEAIEKYYFDKEQVKLHGSASRAKIITDYKWQNIADKLYDIIYKVSGVEKPDVASSVSLIDEVEKIDIGSLSEPPPAVATPEPIKSKLKKRNKEIERLKKKLQKLTQNDNSNDS